MFHTHMNMKLPDKIILHRIKIISFIVIFIGVILSYFLADFINLSFQSSQEDIYENDVLSTADRITFSITEQIELESSVATSFSLLQEKNPSISFFNGMAEEYVSRNKLIGIVYIVRSNISSVPIIEDLLSSLYDRDVSVLPIGDSLIEDEDLWIAFNSFPNDQVIGLELNSEPIRRTVLSSMVEQNSPSITPFIVIATGGKGLISFEPIYKNGVITACLAKVLVPELTFGNSIMSFTTNYPDSGLCIYVNNEIIIHSSNTDCKLHHDLVFETENNIISTRIIFSDYKYDKFSGLFFLLFFLLSILVIFLTSIFIAIDQGRRKANISSDFKTKFISDISHEIRTPMNGIMGMSEVLQCQKLSAENMGYIDTIRSCGFTLLSIVNDILDMSKIESQMMDIRIYETNIMKSISHSVRNSWFTFKTTMGSSKKDLKMVLSIRGNFPSRVLCDDTRVQQILMNLITNALKFTEKGLITIDVFSEKLEANKLSMNFSVTDTGIGMSPESVKLAFEAFTQVHPENMIVGGTGLGLTISNKLCTMMGGELSCKSVVGQGTVFSFNVIIEECHPFTSITPFMKTYEYDSVPEMTTVEENDQSRIDLSYMNQLQDIDPVKPYILIVDDVYTNRLVLTTIFSLFDIGFETCKSGRCAIDICQTVKFSLILMDMIMPIKNGTQATLEIKKSDCLNKETCVLFLSANVSSDAYDECIKAGGSDYMCKPVSQRVLLENLCKYLEPGEVKWIKQKISEKGSDDE